MSCKWNEKVARSFEVGAQKYDRYCDVQSTVAQSLADEFPSFEHPEILEIGCGTGALTQHLLSAYKGARFHITDISPHMLAQARERLASEADIRWSIMNGERPSLDQKYDLIVSNMVFQWFEDIEGALEKLRGFLRPGGTLLYTMPAPESFKEWTGALRSMSLPVGVLDFKMPQGVFRQEEMAIQYESTFHFLKALKHIGAHTPREGYQSLGYRDLLKACRKADECSQGKITWRVLYGRLGALDN